MKALARQYQHQQQHSQFVSEASNAALSSRLSTAMDILRKRFDQDRRPTPHEVDELESALALAQKLHLSSELLEV